MEKCQTSSSEKTANTENKKIKKRDYLTIHGVEYPIDAKLLEHMKWRNAVDAVGKDLYYNFREDSVYPMSRFVPDDVLEKGKVAAVFAGIITKAFGVKVSPDNQWVFIPKRMEYDMNGNLVHSLDCASFEDGLNKLESFIKTTGHYPFSGGDEYECSLRRWYQEVKCGIIRLTDIQRKCFDNISELYPNAIKSKSQILKHT